MSVYKRDIINLVKSHLPYAIFDEEREPLPLYGKYAEPIGQCDTIDIMIPIDDEGEYTNLYGCLHFLFLIRFESMEHRTMRHMQASWCVLGKYSNIIISLKPPGVALNYGWIFNEDASIIDAVEYIVPDVTMWRGKIRDVLFCLELMSEVRP